jgi:ubiquinone/menaquinone biosynthesis C-methylase UbiE
VADSADIEILETRDGYDRWAEIYDGEGNPLIALEEPLVAQLLGDVRGLSIVDVGCGTGRHALALSARGADVTAVDFSEEMLARARTKPGADRVRFVAHDLARPLPFADASFDRATCGLVLDHIGELERFFIDVRRVLRPRGFAVFSVMHPAMMLRGIQARFVDPESGREIRPRSETHQIADYVTAALRAGFEIEHVSEHAADEALAARTPRAAKYLGWPMLLLLRLGRDS